VRCVLQIINQAVSPAAQKRIAECLGRHVGLHCNMSPLRNLFIYSLQRQQCRPNERTISVLVEICPQRFDPRRREIYTSCELFVLVGCLTAFFYFRSCTDQAGEINARTMARKTQLIVSKCRPIKCFSPFDVLGVTPT